MRYKVGDILVNKKHLKSTSPELMKVIGISQGVKNNPKLLYIPLSGNRTFINHITKKSEKNWVKVNGNRELTDRFAEYLI